MKKKVKDIDRPFKQAVFQHNYFFKGVRHGVKWSKQHENCHHNEDRVRNLVKKVKHDLACVFKGFGY
ncbi:MAG: hypothetical protein KKB30_03015 [Proteobacteria bacterium]|nr:hypothetical protein [Pseudomonadota bacterium]MBU1716072.1 hypothetical protein [Pseudomonadota bacterium]